MNRFRLTAAATFLLVACSGGEKSGEKPSTSAGTPAADAPATASESALDACALVSAGDVNAAFAPRVFEVDNSGPSASVKTKFGSSSSCTFVSKGASIRDMVTVSLTVSRAFDEKNAVTVAQMKKGVVDLKGTPVDVPGLGDAAHWYNLDGPTRSSIGLQVQEGKLTWLNLGESSVGQPADVTVARLSKVASAALAKL